MDLERQRVAAFLAREKASARSPGSAGMLRSILTEARMSADEIRALL